MLDDIALDKYSFVRDAYLQRRRSLVYDGETAGGTADVEPGAGSEAGAAHVELVGDVRYRAERSGWSVARARRQCFMMFQTVSAPPMLLAAAGFCRARPDARRKRPTRFVKTVSTDVIDAVKADKAIQAGDISKIIALVDAKVMPHVNFQRMTASAVGRSGARRRPSSRSAAGRVQDAAGAHLRRRADAGERDQTVELKPMRGAPADKRSRGAAPRCAARASRSSSTTGSRRPAAAGRSTTSTCWASGWSTNYRNSSRRDPAAPAASTA